MKKLILTILLTALLLTGFQFTLTHLAFKEVRAANNSSYEFPLRIIDFTKGKLEQLGGGAQVEGAWIKGLFIAILDWFIKLAGVLAVIAIIYSGILYITALGQPEKTERAKKNLTWAIIALVVIVLVEVIPVWVYDILTKEP